MHRDKLTKIHTFDIETRKKKGKCYHYNSHRFQYTENQSRFSTWVPSRWYLRCSENFGNGLGLVSYLLTARCKFHMLSSYLYRLTKIKLGNSVLQRLLQLHTQDIFNQLSQSETSLQSASSFMPDSCVTKEWTLFHECYIMSNPPSASLPTVKKNNSKKCAWNNFRCQLSSKRKKKKRKKRGGSNCTFLYRSQKSLLFMQSP